MIEVDGRKYTEKDIKEAIRERQEFGTALKRLMGPFTCNHKPEYAGSACAACHALWIDAAEKAERAQDVATQQFAALLGKAMERLCVEAKCTNHHKDCPGSLFGRWAIVELVPSNFVGKPKTHCVECKGGGEIGLADGDVPCQSCGGSGQRDRKGVFYKSPESWKCSKCGKGDTDVTRPVFLKDPRFEYLCHKCDREE